jgi:enterochelin esterase-like enzyme
MPINRHLDKPKRQSKRYLAALGVLVLLSMVSSQIQPTAALTTTPSFTPTIEATQEPTIEATSEATTEATPDTTPTSTPRPPFQDGLLPCPQTPVCRVAKTWTADELTARAEIEAPGENMALWSDSNELTYFFRSEGDVEEVRAVGTLTVRMERVEDADTESDLWAATVQVSDLPFAVFSYAFIPYNNGQALNNAATFYSRWRGDEAPPAVQFSDPVKGKIEHHFIESFNYGGFPRTLTIYLPPNHDPSVPTRVIYCTDGLSVDWLALALEPLILNGSIPPVMLIGVDAARGRNEQGDLRGQEYLPDENPDLFGVHERFFVHEVSAWAEQTYGASTRREDKAVFGFSNGGVFVSAMGVRYPDRYGHVIAFSMGYLPGVPRWTPEYTPTFYLMAGTLEPGFLRITSYWSQVLSQYGVPHRFFVRVSSHDAVMWQEEFTRAVVNAFGDASAWF